MSRLTPPIINTEDGLKKLVENLRGCSFIAVDTEMDSYYHYHDKVCLVQISDDNADYLIDPLHLDLSLLNEIFSSPDKTAVFHAGMNDIPHLREEHHINFRKIFDTYAAAEILNLPAKGLAGLIKIYFDIDVDKKYQRADWTIRPLSDEMDLYARGDTRYLIELRSILYKQLEEKNLIKTAERIFSGICRTELHHRSFELDNWIKVKGARDINPNNFAVLRSLYAWREKTAEKLDLSAFRVLPDHTLIGLAERRPKNLNEIQSAFSDSKHLKLLTDQHADILKAIQNGAAEGRIEIPKPVRKGERFSEEEEKVFVCLKNWRNKRAEEGKIAASLMTNKVLAALLKAKPKGLKQLKKLDLLAPDIFDNFAQDILDILLRLK